MHNIYRIGVVVDFVILLVVFLRLSTAESYDGHSQQQQQQQQPTYRNGFPYIYATIDNYNASFPIIEYIAESSSSSSSSQHQPDFLYSSDISTYRVVEFYVHWCDVCKHFKKQYIRFGQQLHSMIELYNNNMNNINNNNNNNNIGNNNVDNDNNNMTHPAAVVQPNHHSNHHKNITVSVYAVSCTPNRYICKDVTDGSFPLIRIYQPYDIIGMNVPHHSQLHITKVLEMMDLLHIVLPVIQQHQSIDTTTTTTTPTTTTNNNLMTTTITPTVTNDKDITITDQHHNQNQIKLSENQNQYPSFFSIGLSSSSSSSSSFFLSSFGFSMIPQRWWWWWWWWLQWNQDGDHQNVTSTTTQSIPLPTTTTTTTTTQEEELLLPKWVQYKSRTRNELQHDIYVSFEYTMRYNVYITNDSITDSSSRSQILYDFLQLMKRTIPSNWFVLRDLILELINNYDYIIQSEDYLHTILDQSKMDYEMSLSSSSSSLTSSLASTITTNKNADGGDLNNNNSNDNHVNNETTTTTDESIESNHHHQLEETTSAVISMSWSPSCTKFTQKTKQTYDMNDNSNNNNNNNLYDNWNTDTDTENTNEQVGYTCGLWELFHVLTVGVVDYNRYTPYVVDRYLVRDVGKLLRHFIAEFFPCSDCRNHFIQYYDNCTKYQRCEHFNDEPDHPTTEQQQQQQTQQSQYEQLYQRRSNNNRDEDERNWIELPLWLHEVHNGVNVRLQKERKQREEKNNLWNNNNNNPYQQLLDDNNSIGISTTPTANHNDLRNAAADDDDSIESSKDYLWPAEQVCSKCWLNITTNTVHKSRMYKYLKLEYGQQDELTAPYYEELFGTIVVDVPTPPPSTATDPTAPTTNETQVDESNIQSKETKKELHWLVQKIVDLLLGNENIIMNHSTSNDSTSPTLSRVTQHVMVEQPTTVLVEHDVTVSLLYTLRYHLYHTEYHESVPPKKKKIVKRLLLLLRKTLPPTWSDSLRNLLNDILDEFDTVMENQDELINLLNEYNKDNTKSSNEWSSQCIGPTTTTTTIGSSSGSDDVDTIPPGYLCGIWSLLHTVTVGVVDYNQRAPEFQQLATQSVATDMGDFVKNLLKCQECGDQYDDLILTNEDCNKEENNDGNNNNNNMNKCRELRDSTDKGNENDWIQLALWLHGGHNDITNRVQQTQKRTERKDPLWPTKEMCPLCYEELESGSDPDVVVVVVVETNVYRFLRMIYGRQDDITMEFRQMNEKAKYENERKGATTTIPPTNNDNDNNNIHDDEHITFEPVVDTIVPPSQETQIVSFFSLVLIYITSFGLSVVGKNILLR